MQEAERALQQIAFGQVILPSGKTRQIYNYEMIIPDEVWRSLNLRTRAANNTGPSYFALSNSNGLAVTRCSLMQQREIAAGYDLELLPQKTQT